MATQASLEVAARDGDAEDYGGHSFSDRLEVVQVGAVSETSVSDSLTHCFETICFLFHMAFAQLTDRESLSGIEACLRSLHSKLYHMGFRGKVSRSTLADANETRVWCIYADFAQASLVWRGPCMPTIL